MSEFLSLSVSPRGGKGLACGAQPRAQGSAAVAHVREYANTSPPVPRYGSAGRSPERQGGAPRKGGSGQYAGAQRGAAAALAGAPGGPFLRHRREAPVGTDGRMESGPGWEKVPDMAWGLNGVAVIFL